MEYNRNVLGRGSRERARRRPAGVLLAGSLAVALLLAAGCGGGGDSDSSKPAAGATNAAAVLGATAPAKGEPVKVGTISDGKSATSDTSIQGRVADATVKYLNEHRSGIGGRPIQLVKCETFGDPARATDCGNRMIEEKVVAVVVGSVSVAESFWEPLHDAHVPVFFDGTSGTSLLLDKDSTFNLSDPIFPLIGMPLDAAKEAGIKKVASIVIDVPAAVDAEKSLAPPMFKEAGIDYELVAIPPGTADMTPQMQRLAANGTGLVHVVGNDTFCISAFNGLHAVGFTGQITAFSDCIDDAVRKAVPAEVLKGMVVSAIWPRGVDTPANALYEAVATTYGSNIDVGTPAGVSIFSALLSFRSAVDKISGEITPATVTATIKAMPETDLPNGTGLKFRCNGKASSLLPAVCVRGGLVTTLDAGGRPTAYKALGISPIPS